MLSSQTAPTFLFVPRPYEKNLFRKQIYWENVLDKLQITSHDIQVNEQPTDVRAALRALPGCEEHQLTRSICQRTTVSQQAWKSLASAMVMLRCFRLSAQSTLPTPRVASLAWRSGIERTPIHWEFEPRVRYIRGCGGLNTSNVETIETNTEPSFIHKQMRTTRSHKFHTCDVHHIKSYLCLTSQYKQNFERKCSQNINTPLHCLHHYKMATKMVSPKKCWNFCITEFKYFPT